MPTQHDRHLSKFLSLILRHQPEAIGLSLDDNGWTEIDTLIARADRHGRRISRSDLERVVAESDKQRFAISEDGLRIRANQGHSVQVDLELQPREPPAVLYHGTVAKFVDAIRREGLLRMARQHVHLSSEKQTAEKVGSRRGRAVILQVDAARMHGDGHEFSCSANGVWLTAHVPPQYLTLP